MKVSATKLINLKYKYKYYYYYTTTSFLSKLLLVGRGLRGRTFLGLLEQNTSQVPFLSPTGH